MSVAGTWKLVMMTPIGERRATLSLSEAGEGLSGTLTNDEGGTTAITDGKLTGNSFAFKAGIKSPMPLTLEFTGKVEGAAVSGHVNASGVGSWGFTGSKG